jgi:hypothetical protein
VSDITARARERIQDQARAHWHEFSIIVASANTLLALALFGRIIIREKPTWNVAIALAIAVASTLAVMLAYYSIQVGILLVFGPLRLTHVLVSFLITATQLALFLWPTYVLSSGSSNERGELKSLRHWLLFYATFAFAAVVASWHAARVRKKEIPETAFASYEKGQRRDKVSASIAGGLVVFCWLLSFHWSLIPVIAGVAISLIASVLGMLSEARVAEELSREVGRT